MADSALGQLSPWFTTVAPMATSLPAGQGLWGARMALALVGPAGNKSVSGYSYLNGSAAQRHITILTQPPQPVVIAGYITVPAAGATFAFAQLPPGNYMVIDSMTDNSRRALVYDWVVA